MGEGWGEGEYSVISVTYIPLPLIPSHQGRGNPTFYELVKFDALAKSRKVPFFVIPAKAGIQSIQLLTRALDSGFHRSDDFLRDHQVCCDH